MGTNPKGYTEKYAKEHLKRIPLDVKKDKYEEIKTAADKAGESVNGFIKKAVDDRLQAERIGAYASRLSAQRPQEEASNTSDGK
ncbi:MAG: hypothetical protein K6G42_10405 [Lachnospiraceae bacterium]|nr:hypothetical protein [Lachnospiraceae bacterium]